IVQRAKDLQAELAELARQRSDVRQAVQAAVERINGEPGRIETWRGLDALIQDQHWRAAHFRVVADDINYRPFLNINQLTSLLVDPSGEQSFTQAYTDFTGEQQVFDEIVRDCKIRIMLNEMASELNGLARDAARVARQNPRTADFTRNILQRALKEIVACFPVYRTYVDGAAKPTEADRRDLDWAVAHAGRHETDLDPSVFDFL